MGGGGQGGGAGRRAGAVDVERPHVVEDLALGAAAKDEKHCAVGLGGVAAARRGALERDARLRPLHEGELEHVHLARGAALAEEAAHHEEQVAHVRSRVREARLGRRARDLRVLPYAAPLLRVGAPPIRARRGVGGRAGAGLLAPRLAASPRLHSARRSGLVGHELARGRLIRHHGRGRRGRRRGRRRQRRRQRRRGRRRGPRVSEGGGGGAGVLGRLAGAPPASAGGPLGLGALRALARLRRLVGEDHDVVVAGATRRAAEDEHLLAHASGRVRDAAVRRRARHDELRPKEPLHVEGVHVVEVLALGEAAEDHLSAGGGTDRAFE